MSRIGENCLILFFLDLHRLFKNLDRSGGKSDNDG